MSLMNILRILHPEVLTYLNTTSINVFPSFFTYVMIKWMGCEDKECNDLVSVLNVFSGIACHYIE